jgi:hypothetical protein
MDRVVDDAETSVSGKDGALRRPDAAARRRML